MNRIDKDVPLKMMTSAMFGPKGADIKRNGPGWWERRTLGLGWIIYGFCRAVEPEVVVEVGAGGSSFCVLEALKHNDKGHLHTIDCWPDSKNSCKDTNVTTRQFEDGSYYKLEHSAFLDGVEKYGFESFCTLYFDKGENMAVSWDKPIDILVVDGGHHLEETKIEIEGFMPHLVPGGYAFFHDPLACIHEVGRQLEDFVNKHEDYSMLIEPDYLSLAIIQRKFTFDFKPMWFAGRLAETDNPQFQTTPMNQTDARACGCLGKWDGRWITGVKEGYSSHDRMRNAAKRLIDSGLIQSIENCKKFIEDDK